MPGAVWKTNVRRVGSGLDRCHNQIDRLEKIDDVEKFKKEIFSNANTRVEVSIKTRRPSKEQGHRKEKNWSSLMSENNTMDSGSGMSSPEIHDVKVTRTRPSVKKKDTKQIRGMKTVTAKKSNPTEKYHFAQPTKSSRAKKMAVEKSPEGKTSSRSKSRETKPMNKKFQRDEDVVDAPAAVGAVNFIQHRFQSRTLNIFLKEMRSALKAENIEEAYKVLNDLEYVAQNLQSPKRSSKEPSPSCYDDERDHRQVHSSSKSNSKEMLDDQKSQVYEITLLRSEAKRLIAENRELKRALSELEHRLADSESELHGRDKNISNLKLIISRLTANNNDMLAILSTKASIEDSAKLLESENLRLIRDLEFHRQKNAQLENKVRQNEHEAGRMHRIILDLKSSLNRNLKEESLRKALHGITDSTIDLELSSDVKSDGGSDADNDDDSAIGEGISESHPLSSGAGGPATVVQQTSKPDQMQLSRASYQQPFAGGSTPQTRASTNRPTAGVSVTSTGVFFNNGPSQLNRNPSAGNNGSSQQSKVIPPPTSLVTQTSRSQEASQQFKAAPLHLSVTRDSDISSNDDKYDLSHFARDDPSQFARDETSQSSQNQRDNSEAAKIAEIAKQNDEMAKKAALASAAQQVDAKVQSFLERLRNDKKFQVSLSSEAMRTQENLSTIGDITGLSTDVESTTSESQKRLQQQHESVEETFNLSNDE